jgi:hypothetical protein
VGEGIDGWVLDLDPDTRWLVEMHRSGRLGKFDHQLHEIGACEHPVWLRGATLKREIASGMVVAQFSSDGTPFDAIAVRCMNRRASRCRPCARLYKGDTFQLVLAGLVGGKGVPAAVRDHPKVFATLTAPSFGLVHRVVDAEDTRGRCQPERSGVCPHGLARTCRERHDGGDAVVGSPLCPGCYDYAGQVLWNAYASKLWGALTDTVYHRLAAVSGERRALIRRLVRVEYIRNAEYQARGVVHFHAVLRLDGPEGRADAPPSWATAEVLAAAIESAAETVTVTAPESAAVGERVLRFGAEKDVRPVVDAAGRLGTEKVAAYLAKYVSKGTEDAHGVDVPITHASKIELWVKNDHARALMYTAWRLGGLAEYESLGLRRWCHMIGFPGHNTTKSQRYSVTL